MPVLELGNHKAVEQSFTPIEIKLFQLYLNESAGNTCIPGGYLDSNNKILSKLHDGARYPPRNREG